jgi:hypothetical protein
MAERSHFFGIIIRMFAEHGGKHHTPHFHREHPIYHITEFEIVAPYTLRIKFDDNTEQTIHFEPLLHGEISSPLRDLTVFNQVRLDKEVRTLVWPNDADFDPADLHDWPEIHEGFIEHVQNWKLA